MVISNYIWTAPAPDPRPSGFCGDIARKRSPPVELLTRGGRGSSLQVGIADAPDPADTAAAADEQRRRSDANKRQQQRVLDQVLPLLVPQKTLAQSHPDCSCSLARLNT